MTQPMTQPVIPLLAAEACGWFYRLGTDDRRHADRLAITLTRRMFGTTPDRLAAVEVRLLLAQVRQRMEFTPAKAGAV